MKRVLIALLLASNLGSAQVYNTDWFNLSYAEDSVAGVEVNRAYSTYDGGDIKTVVVAVIDDGVDVFHEDLTGKIWTNEQEIPDNGIDDDQNGYIDDYYGWNFLGNPNGENISFETLEVTRLCRSLAPKFEGVEKADIPQDERGNYELYLQAKDVYEAELLELNEEFAEYSQILAVYQGATAYMKGALGTDSLTINDLLAFKPADEEEGQIRNFLVMASQEGINEFLAESGTYFDERLNYHYNLEFDPRSIVNEESAKALGTAYGNNMVWAEDPSHGTHVAGIIAAQRDNEIGVDGVAVNAKVMALRAVPNGDERDKDIANAIRYAVDNGAKVINMSFGKSFSPNQELVDEAIRYAQSRDVLMVHAAGNDGSNLETDANFPDGTLGGKRSISTWLTVGASGAVRDTTYLASFSNYGKKKLDILAPGVDILSLVPNDGVDSYSGTSMAAPVVTGIATLLRGIYPEKSAEEIKQLILDSVEVQKNQLVNTSDGNTKLKKVVSTPGSPSVYRIISSKN